MTKKKRITLVIILIVLALLIIWWRLYLFSYEDCIFTTESGSCSNSCGFMNVITHNYCE